MLHSSAIHQSRKSVGGSPSRARGNVRMHCGGLSKTIKWLVSQRGNKYNISEGMINMYTWHLNLTIRHIMKSDFGAYSCSSVNALGKSEARIRLQELRLPPKPTTTPTPYVHTTATPRRKPPLNMNKDLNEVHPDHMSSALPLLSSQKKILGGKSIHTQLPARNSYEKTHKTPPVVPSPRSPWVITNEAVTKLGSQRTVNVGTSLVVALCTFFYGSQIYAISTPN
ncbi:hypothetical protein GQX74_009142 [Glossina fuscipes]|nr:hypothetical protein GQX74_009142 [Glossina fuscipes]